MSARMIHGGSIAPIKIKGKDEYAAIQSEEEHSLLPQSDDLLNVPSNAKKKKKKKKKRKKVSCWKLIANFNFLFFVANAIAVIGIFAWWFMLRPNAQIPYIISGITGLIICITGYRTFNQLMQITQQANVFEKNNKQFKGEHRKIRGEVNKIRTANKQLRQTELRLRAANKKNQQNLSNFKEVQTFMKQMDTKDFEAVMGRANQIGKKWHSELLQQERDMLHLIFDRYEMNHDSKDGMSEQEFNKFAACLPEAYQKRFARLGTFEKLSNGNGVLEYADFEMVLDVFAEMVVDDVDIELNIVKQDADGLGSPHLLATPIVSELSEDVSYGSDDEESEDGNGNGGGFLSKLTTWRRAKTQKRRSQMSNRSLVISSKTPTSPEKGKKMWEMFDFGNDDNNKKKRKEKEEEKEIKRIVVQNVVEEEPEIVKKPKVVKTASTINALHNVDDASLDDDDINAYMQQQAMNDADEEP